MKHTARIVCFGEILWDIFPQGKRIGGAPFNLAYHLDKLGMNAYLISRIGDDEDAEDIRIFLEKRGLQQVLLQKDEFHPTGRVIVSTSLQNEVSYDIVRPAAWDFIASDETVEILIDKADYLVYGSLSSRHETSGATLRQLLKKDVVKVLDVNLRAPFYSSELLEILLGHSAIVKMNADECAQITGWFGCTGDHETRMKALKELFNIDILIVTHGAGGAFLLCNDKMYFERGYNITVSDTVGSGDAFLAAFLANYVNGHKPEAALKSANALGAFIAQYPGACPDYAGKEIDMFMSRHILHQ